MANKKTIKKETVKRKPPVKKAKKQEEYVTMSEFVELAEVVLKMSEIALRQTEGIELIIAKHNSLTRDVGEDIGRLERAVFGEEIIRKCK